MDRASNLELLRLTAAIAATEVQLARKHVKLRAANQQGKTTIVIDAHVAALVRKLDRFHALRTKLLSDPKGEA